ncbi:hypothetical protein GE09DRAFT_592312 [Coniochaeta sp. 2T2.1]|nr:hypothetical protein GE09DRAFT_592312 [Coniochaeta sp. 2T2.1]
MQSTLLVSLLLAAVTSAQTTTTTPTTAATTSSSTSLPSLLASFPQCVFGCFSQAATAVNCQPTDFTCLCADSSALITNIGPCILTAGCSVSEINKIRDMAPQLCSTVQSDTNPADVSAASSFVSSALATVTGTPTASGNGAARTGAALGVLGMAGAFAVLGL